jgi:ubiquitin-protein ligase
VIVVLFDTSSSMDLDGFALSCEQLPANPIDSSRRQGDIRKGDTVRFPPHIHTRGVPSGTLGIVLSDEDGDGDVTVKFRGYQEAAISVRELEVLTPKAAAEMTTLSRMSTVQQLFGAFANRSMAYDLPHVIGLTTFASKVKQVHALSESFESFRAAVDECKADGRTALYDGLEAARQELVQFCSDCTNSPPEGILKRVIVLTDGSDTCSEKTAHTVAANLQADHVVVDAIVIGNEIEDFTLRAIAVASGGCAFHPRGIKEALHLFETETILSLRKRKASGSSSVGRIASDAQLKMLEIGRGVAGWDEPPSAKVPDGVNGFALQPTAALNKARADPPTSNVAGRSRRIMREIARYARDQHPAIEVFPSEERLDLWQLLLRGPEDTPYAGGVFRLWMLFPKEYPAEAPECRFQTRVYHCNINSSGKVCHSVFDRNWTTDMTVRQILDCVYGLLMAPEPDDPLDSVLAMQYLSEPTAYASAAAECTRTHASSSYDVVRAAILQADGGDQRKGNTEGHPPHLVCPITLCLLTDPVSTKYGHTYERQALMEHIARSETDPLTRQPLTAAEVFPSIAIKHAVEAYKAAAPWWED